MKRIFFTSFFLFIFTKLFSQSDYRPGYIITLSNDTLHGLIDFRNSGRNREICDFKRTDSASSESYNPSNLYGYKFNESKYYVSKEIDVNKLKEKLFLEYIIDGKIDLFFYRDASGEHYLIDKEGIGITELTYAKEIINTDQGFFERPTTKHIGILKYYMQDAPDLIAEIENIKQPNQSNLVRLIKHYQEKVCSDTTCIRYEKRNTKSKINFELTQGLFHYTDDPQFYRYQVGGLIYFSLPSLNEHLKLKSGIYYAKPQIYYYADSVNSTLNLFRFPIQLQYTIPNKKIQPRVEFGYTITNIDFSYYQSIDLGIGFFTKLRKNLNLTTGVNLEILPIFEWSFESQLIVSHSLYLGFQF